MKIPYIKIYTADLLAKSRRLSPQQIGEALIGICEQAFENETQYEPENEAEGAFYKMLLDWKNESISALKQKKLAGKKGGKSAQARHKLSDGSTACFCASSTHNKQTDTETDTETDNKLKEKSLLKKETETVTETVTETEKKPKFAEPDIETVSAYCKERGNSINAESFVAYYKARGWKLKGNVPMKDWRAAVITWEKNQKGGLEHGTDYNRNPEPGKYAGLGRKIG